MISEALVRKGKSLNAGAGELKPGERAVWGLIAEADAALRYRGAGYQVAKSQLYKRIFMN